MISKIIFLLLIAIICCKSAALPQDYEDLNSAASDHDHHGRVQIKVYRGPTEHDGHEHYAPWGFWVKQPADDYHH